MRIWVVEVWLYGRWESTTAVAKTRSEGRDKLSQIRARNHPSYVYRLRAYRREGK